MIELEQYLWQYEIMKDLEAALNDAKSELNARKTTLMQAMSENGLTSMSTQKKVVTWSKRVYGKVLDFDRLVEYVETVNTRTISESDIEEFIKHPVKGLVHLTEGLFEVGINKEVMSEYIEEAQRESSLVGNGSLEDNLPPGLGVSITEIVTVRNKTNNRSINTKNDSVSRLKDMIGIE